MRRHLFAFAIFALLAASREAAACGPDSFSLFSCETDHEIDQDRKFIQLCDSSVSGETVSLQYRFGTRTSTGEEHVELEFPEERLGSLDQFLGATYTHKGASIYSVRFVSGEFSYTVFTQASADDHRAGVKVRNQRTGKTDVVECGEQPRFYIFELKDVLACDPATPVGTACIK